MHRTMKIRVSEAPVAHHIRLHTERDDWDEPDVRYLRPKTNEQPSTLPLHPVDEDRVVFEFGNIEVTIRAVADHVEIVLRHLPSRVAIAA